MQHLSQFGAVTDEGFWINKIKSHCYVTVSFTLLTIPPLEFLMLVRVKGGGGDKRLLVLGSIFYLDTVSYRLTRVF